jgi:Transposase IS66 family
LHRGDDCLPIWRSKTLDYASGVSLWRSGYAGFNRLYEANRKPGPVVEAACWAHARRKFFDLARLNQAPIAIEAVERIDGLFDIEREINGTTPRHLAAL